jgi:glycosyltransferase involved in cell wall biosynthesis
MRVFVGFREVAGYYTNLVEGFRAIGVNCTLALLHPHRFQYREKANLRFLYVVRKLFGVFDRLNRKGLARKIARLVLGAIVIVHMIPLFVWAIVRHDAFVFESRSSFFSYLELPILKWLKKKVIFVFHGSDVRPPYLDGANMWEDGVLNCIRRARHYKKRARIIEKYADAVVCYTAISHFLEKPFIQWTKIGFPYMGRGLACPTCRTADSIIRVLHCPSVLKAKGTYEIRETVQRLLSKGIDFEYTEISGRPNEEVLKEMATSDLLVDQVYADAPMGAVSVEAGWHGCPSIIAGYYVEESKSELRPEETPPTIYCHPDSLEQTLEKLITDGRLREDFGRRLQAFVRTNWAVTEVAERYLRILRGDVPRDWYFNPLDLRYVKGAGAPEAQIRNWIRATVETGGKQALQLPDKPVLLKGLLSFADIRS